MRTLYYKIRRDENKKYVVILYYRNFLNMLTEYHHSSHDNPKQINEVIQYYRNHGHLITSIASAC